MSTPLHVGFIPLVDAAALIVAVDKGFAAEEGLDVTLVREVSWSNVRDKLNIGLFDAAHLLAPVAIASSLGIGHVKVPIVAPFNLGINGNAITVSPALHAAIMAELDGDRFDPMATALALARVVAARRKTRRRTAHLRDDLSVLDPQLPAAFLDGGGRGRSRRGCAPRRAAAALHGGDSRRRPDRWLLRRRALEFDRGRSRCRPHPAFRLRHPGAGGGESAGDPARLGGAEIQRSLPRWFAPPRAAPPLSSENRAETARILAQPETDRRRCRTHPAYAGRTPEDLARRHHARERPLSRWSAGKGPTGPIPCRRPGSTRRWCAGARRRSAPRRSRPRWRCSGPISTTRRWGKSRRCCRCARPVWRLRRPRLRSRRYRRLLGLVRGARPDAIDGR